MFRSRIKTALSACCILMVYAAPTAAQAQEHPRDGMSLNDVVRSLFAESPAFRTFGVQTRGAAGEQLRASGAFDVVAQASVTGQRSLWTTPYGAFTSNGYNSLSLQGGMSVLTRTNVFAEIVASAPLLSSLSPSVSSEQPSTTVRLNVPLLKLGRDAGPGAAERAAEFHASGAIDAQRDFESALVAQVAVAYWRWVGSCEQLKLARRLEALANEQLRDVDELIAGHARASSDRLPFVATLQNVQATVTQAEQGAFDQQQALWATLGLSRPVGRAEPSDSLPTVSEPEPLATLATELRRLAAKRPLLAYLAKESAAARTQLEAARIAERPDLTLSAQGTATRLGSSGLPESAAANENGVGYYGGISLGVRLPILNRTSRGAFATAQAAAEERDLEAMQRERVVFATLDALASALVTEARAYDQRVRAASVYQDSYDAERARFKLGTATVMDVVVAEQQLMTSNVAVLVSRTSYAITLARVLHESGILDRFTQSRDAGAVAQRLVSQSLFR